MVSSESLDLRRAVVQQLESMRRSGLTHWKQIEPLSLDEASPPGSAGTSSKPQHETQAIRSEATSSTRSMSSPAVVVDSTLRTATAGPKSSGLTNSSSRSTEMPSGSKSPRVSNTAKSPSADVTIGNESFQALKLPRSERIARLSALAEVVKACQRCEELACTRKQTVFGVGNPEARIMFVGEAPGADEDAQGEPFVGRAGQLLNDIITACRMKREDIYICNVLRCRPPGNRQPTPEEASNCREYLDGQIAVVNPDYIVCWGATAAKNLLATEAAIGKLRGRFFQYGRAKVLCTYHPSYLLRNPAAKKDVWDDMKFFFLDMGIDLSKK